MKSRRVFWIAAAVLTILWLVANRPRVEESPEPDMAYVTKQAGWPDRFYRWSVQKDTGETFYSSFSTGPFLFNLALLAAPITAAWFLTRPPRPEPDKAAKRPGRSSSGQLPTMTRRRRP